MNIKTAYNRRLAQWRVSWLIEHPASHQLLWCIESFVLRNPPLRQAPNRYTQMASFLFKSKAVTFFGCLAERPLNVKVAKIGMTEFCHFHLISQAVTFGRYKTVALLWIS